MDNPKIPLGVVKRVKLGTVDKSTKLVSLSELSKSRLVKVEGSPGISLSPNGVYNVVNLVLDKSGNLVRFIYRSTVLEISKLVSPVNPDISDISVNKSKLDKSILVNNVDLETSNESNR